MSMTEAQKRDAYLEAKHILGMDTKWQELMPGERKPNFKRAAREIIRRALGHKVRRNETALNLHSGLMHEHEPREARLLERTLRNGMHPPHILHSFQHGVPESRDEKPKPYMHTDDPDLPDVEVYIHDHGQHIDYPSHYEPGTDTYHSSVHRAPEHAIVPLNAPAGTRLSSEYEAVH